MSQVWPKAELAPTVIKNGLPTAGRCLRKASLSIEALRSEGGGITHFVAVFSDLAERPSRSARTPPVPGPRDRPQRTAFAADPHILFQLLPSLVNPPVSKQGISRPAASSAGWEGKHCRLSPGRRPALDSFSRARTDPSKSGFQADFTPKIDGNCSSWVQVGSNTCVNKNKQI